MRNIVVSVVLGCLLLAGGCASKTGGVTDSVSMDLASETTIYFDNWVRRSPIQMYVHPDIAPPTPPTALFFPFRLNQRMENAVSIGHNLSRYIWQIWLQNKVLPTIELAQTPTPYRPDMALAMAKARGADLVIGGYITHFMDGGTVGDTIVSLAVEIYDVRSGNLLWSMAQGGFMQRGIVQDYLLVAAESRMPTDPAGAVVSALAGDMGRAVRDWVTPRPPDRPWYYTEPQAFR